MSTEDGERPVYDWTDALCDAEVEMFLKKGILDSNLDGCCAGAGGMLDEDIELSLL